MFGNLAEYIDHGPFYYAPFTRPLLLRSDSAIAILTLNEGARRGGICHDSGEGSISRLRREKGRDLTWEICGGYFGCRNPQGGFDEQKLKGNAATDADASHGAPFACRQNGIGARLSVDSCEQRPKYIKPVY